MTSEFPRSFCFVNKMQRVCSYYSCNKFEWITGGHYHERQLQRYGQQQKLS